MTFSCIRKGSILKRYALWYKNLFRKPGANEINSLVWTDIHCHSGLKVEVAQTVPLKIPMADLLPEPAILHEERYGSFGRSLDRQCLADGVNVVDSYRLLRTGVENKFRNKSCLTDYGRRHPPHFAIDCTKSTLA